MRITKKIGYIFSPSGKSSWWVSHAMAPSAVITDNKIRVFLGGWDVNNISRITYIDLDITNPKNILNISDKIALDIGGDGCFDENGVFPAHAFTINTDTIYLYYTGFQLGSKIRHYNFGGLAVSNDGGDSFSRIGRSPILDRQEEGLFVRAGQSIYPDEASGYHSVYSAGSSWFECGNEQRPVYDIFYQKTPDGIVMQNKGKKIIEADFNYEHGLGRPQIIKFSDWYYCFYTRRIIKDMKYFMGAARSKNLLEWEKVDDIFDDLNFGKKGEFDSDMMYFPSILKISETRGLIFYSGNYFGEGGLGLFEMEF